MSLVNLGSISIIFDRIGEWGICPGNISDWVFQIFPQNVNVNT